MGRRSDHPSPVGWHGDLALGTELGAEMLCLDSPGVGLAGRGSSMHRIPGAVLRCPLHRREMTREAPLLAFHPWEVFRLLKYR